MMFGKDTYGNIHTLIANWSGQGKIWPEYSQFISPVDYTEFDAKILKIFGYKGDDLYWQAMSLTEDIWAGKLDVSWLFGPHGLTLLKVLDIKSKDTDK